MSPVAYRLELPQELAAVHPVFHVSLLKPHHGPVPPTRAPVFLGTEDTPEYEVDRIIGMRLGAHNQTEYLVLWKGYGAHDATWEPRANLENAPRAVRDFER